MIIKYKSKSEKEFFDSLEKIEFSSKIFALTSDNFDNKFFLMKFLSSHHSTSLSAKKSQKEYKKKARFKINYYESKTKSREKKKV